MNSKGDGLGMLVPTLVMAALAVVLVFLTYRKGDGLYVTALRSGGTMLLKVLPLLIFAFIVAGALPLLIPREIIAQWIGAESGIRGILIGTIVGGAMPGGPYVSLPLAAGFLRIGAGVGTMVAFVTGWSLLALSRLPVEIGIMGWKFTLIRLACTFFFAPIAGLIAHRFFSGVSIP